MDFPFAALVGLDQLKTALLANAVYPGIGGVLIRGERGTAKSTAARALAALLPPIAVVPGCPFQCDPAAVWPDCPHCHGDAADRAESSHVPVPFVDLPLGATEDRVIGTLDFERALREGRRGFHPGLLAAAHRGILYIDEVNLLPDHLVDALLDAAAAGVNHVAREGVSVSHPARFLLVGTMNPEEGELRPQLLDRFGLVVEVLGPREPGLRADVVRRRLAFESDPAGFNEQWQAAQAELAAQVAAARGLLPGVRLDDDLLALITKLCCEFDVDGLRADLALHKTARALAALAGLSAVTPEEIKTAAALVLPHRRKRQGMPPPPPRAPLDQDKLDDLVDEARGDRPPPPSGGAGPDDTRVIEPGQPARWPRMDLEQRTSSPLPGRRQPSAVGQGRYVRAVADPKTRDPALTATIQAAARRGAALAPGGVLAINAHDLHGKERAGTAGTLILFVVDASGSMAARRRMELAKGAVLGLLADAYARRDQVAVIAFRGLSAEVLLPATGSVELAERALRALPSGGRTPLAHGLEVARETAAAARQGRPDLPILLVLLSDGKANVPLPDTNDDPWQQALAAAARLAAENVRAIVVDSELGFVRAGRAQQLAEALGAECRPLEEISADQLVAQVRQRG